MPKITLLITLILYAALHSVRSEEGYCPQVKTMTNFKLEKYTGRWYEIQKYPFFFEDELKCVLAEYTIRPDGNMGLINKAVLQQIDEPISIKGKATPEPIDPANLTVVFDKMPGTNGMYWVLDTDYKSYSLVYGCKQARDEPIRVEFAWILSRKPRLSGKIISSLTKKLKAFGSTVSNFVKTDQANCDYSVYDLDE